MMSGSMKLLVITLLIVSAGTALKVRGQGDVANAGGGATTGSGFGARGGANLGTGGGAGANFGLNFGFGGSGGGASGGTGANA